MPQKITRDNVSLEGAQLPFEEQIAFFRQKVPVPTARWDDLRRNEHDTGFMVAGAMKADLLADLQQAVADTAAGGGTLEEFRKGFRDLVSRHGWHGWTGEGTAAGEAWRTRVIYQTNMLTSYAAGRLAQLRDPELRKIAPYWMYRHSDSVMHPRPLHVSWDKLTLPADDPWFRTHYPPNGWGCCCYVIATSKTLAEMQGGRFGPPPDDGIDPKTGGPMGIDKGWDYMPGDTATERIRQALLAKADKLPPPIGADLRKDLGDLPAMPPAADYVGVVSTDFRRAMEDGLSTVPDKVRQEVSAAGYGVAGGRNLIEIAPRLAGVVPPGYPSGATWEHADAATLREERLIAVAEAVRQLDGGLISNTRERIGALLRHEHAHVFDGERNITLRSDFIDAYEADAVGLRSWLGRLGGNQDAERDIRYMLQAGRSGRREVFADLFAEHYGGLGTAATVLVSRAMPRTADIVRRIMEDLLK
jgi:hypothetical protein